MSTAYFLPEKLRFAHAEAGQGEIDFDGLIQIIAKGPSRLTFRNYKRLRDAGPPASPGATLNTPSKIGEERDLTSLAVPLKISKVQREANVGLLLDQSHEEHPAPPEIAQVANNHRSQSPNIARTYLNRTRSVLQQSPSENELDNYPQGLLGAYDEDSQRRSDETEHSASTSPPQDSKTKKRATNGRKAREKTSFDNGDVKPIKVVHSRKRRRRIRNPFTELALVRSVEMSFAADIDSKHHLKSPADWKTITTSAKKECATRPSTKLNISRQRENGKSKTASKIARRTTYPLSNSICVDDFRFPAKPTTPNSKRSIDWTPGSGFQGMSSQPQDGGQFKKRRRTQNAQLHDHPLGKGLKLTKSTSPTGNSAESPPTAKDAPTGPADTTDIADLDQRATTAPELLSPAGNSIPKTKPSFKAELPYPQPSKSPVPIPKTAKEFPYAAYLHPPSSAPNPSDDEMLELNPDPNSIDLFEEELEPSIPPHHNPTPSIHPSDPHGWLQIVDSQLLHRGGRRTV